MRGPLALCGILIAAPVLAYHAPPPHGFAKPAAGGKYVLVVLQKLDGTLDKKLKEKYARSGQYPAGDPARPAWTCDWLADWERNVFASDDGVYAVRITDGDPGGRHWVLSYEKEIPRKQPGWEDVPALFIYQKGVPHRMLTLRELFDTSPFTDRDCFMGPILTIDSFQDTAGRVVISTEAGGRKRTATVAFRTGEVVERGTGGAFEFAGGGGGSWGRFVLAGLAVVGVLSMTFVVAAVLLIRNQRTGKG